MSNTINSVDLSIPRVSILMTVYNAEHYVGEAINSLLEQTFHDWELIAVDDGSLDTSLSILQEYSDSRLRVLPLEKNIGRTSALRIAFDQARGDYVAVLDADDISSSNRLMRQVEFLDKNPGVALVASWAQYVDEHGKVFNELKPPVNQDELFDSLGWTNPIAHSSVMYRRQVAHEVGGYPADIIWAQDFGLILAIAQRAKIAMIDDYLCKLRVLSNSMTRSRKNRIIVATETKLLFQQAADTLKLSKKSLNLNRSALTIAEIKLGMCMLNLSFLSGVTMIVKGVIFCPSILWNNGFVRKKVFGAKF